MKKKIDFCQVVIGSEKNFKTFLVLASIFILVIFENWRRLEIYWSILETSENTTATNGLLRNTI